MFEALGDANAVALIGLIGGIALGLAARIGRFCTLGAIEDFLYAGDDRRLRMWAVAIGVAIVGSHGAMAFGWLDPVGTRYLAQTRTRSVRSWAASCSVMEWPSAGTAAMGRWQGWEVATFDPSSSS